MRGRGDQRRGISRKVRRDIEYNRNRVAKPETECLRCCTRGHFAKDCTATLEQVRVGQATRAACSRLQETALVLSDMGERDTETVYEHVYKISVCPPCKQFSFFAKNVVLLDNQASQSVFRDEELVTSVKDMEVPFELRGVQEGAEGITVTNKDALNTSE